MTDEEKLLNMEARLARLESLHRADLEGLAHRERVIERDRVMREAGANTASMAAFLESADEFTVAAAIRSWGMTEAAKGIDAMPSAKKKNEIIARHPTIKRHVELADDQYVPVYHGLSMRPGSAWSRVPAKTSVSNATAKKFASIGLRTKAGEFYFTGFSIGETVVFRDDQLAAVLELDTELAAAITSGTVIRTQLSVEECRNIALVRGDERLDWSREDAKQEREDSEAERWANYQKSLLAAYKVGG